MNRIAPLDEDETVSAVRDAAASHTTLEIVSGGSKRDFGRPVRAGAILDMSALTGILKYEPEELVLKARAATTLAEVEAVLAPKNQMLGFEPADWGPLFGAGPNRGTLAGIVGANVTGARRVKAGAVRDSIIGCRFVNGRGEAIKAGGPVIKNVTGFDLPKLMCGAFGTLGALTELTFKVMPVPECVAVMALGACGAEEGLRLLREAASLPLDATGLSYLPAILAREAAFEEADGLGVALIRIEGTKAAIEEKLGVLDAKFSGHPITVRRDEEAKTLFRAICDGAFFVNRACDIWRLCVPPSQAFAAASLAASQYWYADWTGGLLWLDLPASEEASLRLRTITTRLGGHATLMRGSPEARAGLAVFEPESKTHAALTRSVRAAFDPHHIFNPGRMGEAN